MSFSVERISPGSREVDSVAAVFAKPETLWTSDQYRTALTNSLSHAESDYLLVHNSTGPLAFVPSFRAAGPYGVVANSLPFFGSHGGLFVDPSLGLRDRALVLESLMEYWNDTGVDRVVWVDPLLNPGLASSLPRAIEVASRVTYVSPLRSSMGDSARDSLLRRMHPKHRAAYRKGVETLSGLYIDKTVSFELLSAVWELHRDTSHALSRPAKPFNFFEAFIRDEVDEPTPMRLYGVRNAYGDVVAGLVLFEKGGVVEYFTPVVRKEWRSSQVLTALIFEAMVDSIEEGHTTLWNWGGTWDSQSSLARFKERWGAKAIRYRYWKWNIGDCRDLDAVENKQILAAYPHFFVRPFLG